MRLYTAAALLASASAEVVRDGGVLIDGTRIVAAGPAGLLRARAGTLWPGWMHAARGGHGPAMAEPVRQGPA